MERIPVKLSAKDAVKLIYASEMEHGDDPEALHADMDSVLLAMVPKSVYVAYENARQRTYERVGYWM